LPGSLRVTDVVLVEAVWTLKSAFEQDKHVQLIAVRSLLEETAFSFEDREAVAAALPLFEAASCDSPIAWSSPSMRGKVATSTRVSIEAFASCRGSRYFDLTRASHRSTATQIGSMCS
jgi:predicted nucleic-acid-binding protein